MAEIWIDIYCPFCVGLGYSTARHLMTVHAVGELIETSNQYIMQSCKRCRTKYRWTYGMKLPQMVTPGRAYKSKYEVNQKVAFE